MQPSFKNVKLRSFITWADLRKRGSNSYKKELSILETRLSIPGDRLLIIVENKAKCGPILRELLTELQRRTGRRIRLNLDNKYLIEVELLAYVT